MTRPSRHEIERTVNNLGNGGDPDIVMPNRLVIEWVDDDGNVVARSGDTPSNAGGRDVIDLATADGEGGA